MQEVTTIKKSQLSLILLSVVAVALMMSTINIAEAVNFKVTIAYPTDSSYTYVQVWVQGIFRGYVPFQDRWWILVQPCDSNLVHPGAPVVFCNRTNGEWAALHHIYLTGDQAQPVQKFKIMIALVTPETDALYHYRLEHQIYDYIEMQPQTRVFDSVFVFRML